MSPTRESTTDYSSISPENRRQATVNVLADGLIHLVNVNARAPQNLSETGEKGLELSGKTRLSVPRG